MRPKEGPSRRLMESELFNPDPGWLVPLDVNLPSVTPLLHPSRASHRRRGLLQERLGIERTHMRRQYAPLMEAYDSIPIVGRNKTRELIEADVRELQFRDAIRAYLNDRRVGQSNVADLNVLVVGSDKHDMTIPYELGEFARQVSFLGPLYDDTSRAVCRNAYAMTSVCDFSEVPDEELGVRVALHRPDAYDLILLYGGYESPEFTSKQFAQYLLGSLKPNGRLITSALASLDTLRNDIVGTATDSGDFQQLLYPETAFINLAHDDIYVPSPKTSPERTNNRVVWSLGYEDIYPQYYPHLPKHTWRLPTRKQLVTSGAIVASLTSLVADSGHTAPFACAPTETTINSNYTNSVDTDFRLKNGKEIAVFTNNNVVAISLAPLSVYEMPRVSDFSVDNTPYQLIATPEEVLLCAGNMQNGAK